VAEGVRGPSIGTPI
jgi:hypothetical protein